LEHKEAARSLTLSRLTHFNQFYNHSWNRVAIRNQRRCWGSCTSLGNLNFSYKILFLPPCLSDYIILHELCHLKELNHSPRFWAEMAKVMPDYQTRRRELRKLERHTGTSVKSLQSARDTHTCVHCTK